MISNEITKHDLRVLQVPNSYLPFSKWTPQNLHLKWYLVNWIFNNVKAFVIFQNIKSSVIVKIVASTCTIIKGRSYMLS